jgi:uncharacterized protein YcfJ
MSFGLTMIYFIGMGEGNDASVGTGALGGGIVVSCFSRTMEGREEVRRLMRRGEVVDCDAGCGIGLWGFGVVEAYLVDV